MRLFVAAYPPGPACAHLAATVDTLAVGRAAAAGINARVAAPDNWHMTLTFLGEVPAARQPDVDGAPWIGRSRTGEPGGHPSPLRLRLGGGGRFGRGRFTVLWVGLHGDVAALADARLGAAGAN